MWITRIPDGAYRRRVWLHHGTLKDLQKHHGDDWKPNQRGWYYKEDEDSKLGPKHIVTVCTSDSRTDVLAYLAHECLHLTFAVLGDMGIKHCPDSEEAFTYYFQEMYKKMLAVIA